MYPAAFQIQRNGRWRHGVTESIGILSGFAAAIVQSTSYLFSRDFTRKGRGTIPALFVMSHILMGVVCLALTPLCMLQTQTPFAEFVRPLFGVMVPFMIAQGVLFITLHNTEPSRVVPLLGLKIVALAVLVSLVGHERLGLLSWLAVLLCACAALLLNETGGRLPARAIFGICVVVIGYALSDFQIVILIKKLSASGTLAPFIAVCYAYLVSGMISLPFLFTIGPVRREAWRAAVPFAASWLISMFLLFVSFAIIGVVFGSIMQSTRGLLSILLGVLVAKIGMTHLETHVSRGTLVKRIACALLMASAIVMYVVARQRT